MSNRNSRSDLGSTIGIYAITVVVVLVLYVAYSFLVTSLGLNLFGCINIVPAGNVGVHDVFGNVDKTVEQPGLHLKNPVAGVTTYSVQRVPIDFFAQDNDGLTSMDKDGAAVDMDATVWYHIDGTQAISIYKNLGPDPQRTQIESEVRGIVRSEVANYTTEDVYTGAERTTLEANVITGLNAKLNPLGLYIDDMQITDTSLPPTVVSSINAKLESQNAITTEQNNLAIIQIKAQEQVAAANGEAQANTIVSNSLTPQILQNNAIKALASNANVTVFGSDNFGLTKVI